MADLYSEWRDFYAEKVRSWMNLEELRAECGKLLTVDSPSPEVLLIHAMHLLEEQDKLAAALRVIPADEYDMRVYEGDGFHYFCCKNSPHLNIEHSPGCWYVRVREALAEYDALRAAPKHVPVCDHCGSTDVSAEAAPARWDIHEQVWEVSGICDKGHYCNHCGRETRLAWRPATPEEIGS